MGTGSQSMVAEDGAAGKKSCVARFSDTVNGFIEGGFAKLGGFISRRPIVTIFSCIVLTVLCASGFARFESENRPEELWVPSGTKAQRDKDVVDSLYDTSIDVRNSAFILVDDDAGGDVLEPSVLDRVYSIMQISYSVTAISPIDDRILTYDNMCFRGGDGAECEEVTLLKLFDNNPSNWDTRAKILERINQTPLLDSDGERFVITNVLGSITRDSNDQITGAKAIESVFKLKNDFVEKKSGREDKDGDEWEDVWLDEMDIVAKAYKSEPEGLVFNWYATRSFGDEFGKTIEGDIRLLQLAVILIVGYAFIMLSKWENGCVGVRFVLVLGGVISIALSIVAAYGLCSLFGLFFSNLMSVLPFLMIGIGVDDMFVLVNAYDLVNELEFPTINERMMRMMSKAGASVMITSLTDVVAFLIGSNTTLPALRNFSLYAAFGILFDFIFQITFFAAFMVYDARRQRADRYDVACCAVRSGAQQNNCKCCCHPASFTRTVMRKLGELLCNWWAKAAVVLLWVVLTSCAIYGIATLEVDADANDFIPPGYLKDYLKTSDEHFTFVGAPYGVYVQNVDFPNADTELTGLITAMANNEHTLAPTVNAWYPRFKTWAATPAAGDALTADNFYSKLADWVEVAPEAGGGQSYAASIVWNTYDAADKPVPSDGVAIARFTANFMKLDKSMDQVDSMNSIRDDLAAVVPYNDAFAYSGDFLNYEQYASIQKEAFRNVGLTLAMVFVVVSICLLAPVASFITFGMVASSIVQLLGFMSLWGYTLDSVVVIFVVISLGLAVDYSVHYAHGFLDQKGTGNERMVAALHETGSAVINGGISTLLAVLVLGVSSSYVFQTFFAALLLVVTFGCLNGLVVLPVALSIVKPASRGHEDAVQATPHHSMTEHKGGKAGMDRDAILLPPEQYQADTSLINTGVNNDAMA